MEKKSSEQGNVQFRRSLNFVKDLEAGQLITSEAVRSNRPVYCLSPKYLEKCLGSCVNQPLHAGTPVDWKMFGDESE
ncbi:SAF domain-containing protein [Haliea sp. E1-2-M8]|uniref:SAF domain-containing protein n=1 Tax=Haliea sp. E1-2-M8 TaxID=3064706 RepID=UPI00351CA307